MSKLTCGPLYLEGLKKYTNGDPNLTRIYAAGFVNGQAEKVYLGACRAAMFRPSEENAEMVMDLVDSASMRYGLYVAWHRGEIWLCRTEREVMEVEDLSSEMVDTPEYHLTRAALCGVPIDEVDLQFHKRMGYGERCD